MNNFKYPTHKDEYGDIYHLDDFECFIWNQSRSQWIVYATLEEAKDLNLMEIKNE